MKRITYACYSGSAFGALLACCGILAYNWRFWVLMSAFSIGTVFVPKSKFAEESKFAGGKIKHEQNTHH